MTDFQSAVLAVLSTFERTISMTDFQSAVVHYGLVGQC